MLFSQQAQPFSWKCLSTSWAVLGLCIPGLARAGLMLWLQRNVQPCGAGIVKPPLCRGPSDKARGRETGSEPLQQYRRLLVQTSGEMLLQPEFYLGKPHSSHVSRGCGTAGNQSLVGWGGPARAGGMVCPGAGTHKYRVGLVCPWTCHCSRSPVSG